MQDKNIICKECQAEFVFSVQDQEFFKEKGYTNEPQRCRNCRSAKKQAVRASREMHDVVCAACNKNCQVPFKPRSDKPVYCSDCFQK